MLEIDVAAWPRWARTGSRSSGRRRASPSSRSTSTIRASTARRRRREVRRPQRGALAARPARPRAEGRARRPAARRLANAVDGGSLFWRLLVDVAEGADVTLIEEYVSASSDLPGTPTRSGRALRRPGRSSSTSPSRTSRARRGTSPRTTRVERDAELDWVAGASAQGRIRPADLAGQGDIARHGRVLRRRGATPRLRHLPGAHRATRPRTSPSRRSAIARARCGAG